MSLGRRERGTIPKCHPERSARMQFTPAIQRPQQIPRSPSLPLGSGARDDRGGCHPEAALLAGSACTPCGWHHREEKADPKSVLRPTLAPRPGRRLCLLSSCALCRCKRSPSGRTACACSAAAVQVGICLGAAQSGARCWQSRSLATLGMTHQPGCHPEAALSPWDLLVRRSRPQHSNHKQIPRSSSLPLACARGWRSGQPIGMTHDWVCHPEKPAPSAKGSACTPSERAPRVTQALRPLRGPGAACRGERPALPGTTRHRSCREKPAARRCDGRAGVQRSCSAGGDLLVSRHRREH